MIVYIKTQGAKIIKEGRHLLVKKGAAFVIFLAQELNKPEVKTMRNNGNRHQIEEYQCGTCGRAFYIDPRERTALDIEFGCPYGCDDSGVHIDE